MLRREQRLPGETGPLVRTRRQRNADVKLIVVATIAVLLVGLRDRRRHSSSPPAAAVRVHVRPPALGAADGFATTSTTVRSSRRAGPTAASGCPRRGRHRRLQGRATRRLHAQREPREVRVRRPARGLATLAQYPVSIETIDDVDTVLVDLTDRPASTTAPPTSTRRPSRTETQHPSHVREAHPPTCSPDVEVG